MSEYIIEHDYNCYDSEFYDGLTIYIDSYLYPSYGDTIIIPGGFSNSTCEVTSADKVNIKSYYVDKVLNSDDKIIVTDKSGTQYLVEYGLGCGLSFWRYEGKTIDIDIGGAFLDGIGDHIYLFDSDDDCKVWDAEELSSGGGYSSGGTPSLDDLLKSVCPENSQYLNGQCFCNDGYVASGNVCIPLTCPVNTTKVGNSCVCNEGFVLRNGQCITHTADCRLSFGDHVVGSKGNAGNSSCNCEAGYLWNATQTGCIKIEVQPTITPIQPIERKTEVAPPPPKTEQKIQSAKKEVIEEKPKEDLAKDASTTSLSMESGAEVKKTEKGFFAKVFGSIKNFFTRLFK